MIGLRRRNLGRMAFRNIARRPLEAVMVVSGAALGTAIVTAAFVAGDTFDASIRADARTELGPIDETVAVDDAARLDDVARALDAGSLSDTDGTLSLVEAPAAVRAGDHAEPTIGLGELDFDAARAFGDDVAATGLAGAGPTPSGDEVVINRKLADDLQVGTGDIVEVFAYGQRLPVTVRTITPRVGLAGYNPMYLAPGTLARLAAGAPSDVAAPRQPPIGEILVSNAGGVYDGSVHSAAVFDALDQRVAGMPGVDVFQAKQDLLDEARSSGAEMREMFSALGTFSIAVGVLLLVNLFVMLAEERKAELGMLRALGLKRNHLVRLFGLEGTLYSVVAAALGAVVGIGVGRLILVAMEHILADEVRQEGLSFVFAVQPSSLILGSVVGLAISLITVWATSARIARLNVIRAIRDLPEPAVRRASWLRLVLGAIGMVLGGLILNAGLSGDAAIPVLIGPAVALASAVPLFGRWLPRRVVIATAGGLAAVWSVAALAVAPDAFHDAGIEMFVVQGLVLVGAAVAVLAQGDRAWAWVANRLADRGGLAGRLAVAYPLARRVRTAMLLAMFALITFMLTFMSVLSNAFMAEAPALAAGQSAGWDMWVDSLSTSPVDARDLGQDPDVASTASLTSGSAQLSTEGYEPANPDDSFWPVTGIDEAMLGPGMLDLSERLDRYPDDRAAYEAILADPTLAIAPDWLLEGDDGPDAEAGV
ncbi:MAG TPA: ABC transporter permease, partial [Acidimicrobiales bacterium]|nr:ABC transporter permease [Acidimicrobiales bacterium]